MIVKGYAKECEEARELRVCALNWRIGHSLEENSEAEVLARLFACNLFSMRADGGQAKQSARKETAIA